MWCLIYGIWYFMIYILYHLLFNLYFLLHRIFCFFFSDDVTLHAKSRITGHNNTNIYSSVLSRIVLFNTKTNKKWAYVDRSTNRNETFKKFRTNQFILTAYQIYHTRIWWCSETIHQRVFRSSIGQNRFAPICGRITPIWQSRFVRTFGCVASLARVPK